MERGRIAEKPTELQGFLLRGYNGRVEINLRESRREDFDTLWRIDQQCFPAGIAYSLFELKVYMRRMSSFTLVAERKAEPGTPKASHNVAGFIVAESGRKGLGHIITIDVLPEFRRAGVASRLLAAAEDRLKAGKCHGVVLETAVDNEGALAFYKRHKYFEVKKVAKYYSNGVDAMVLTKPL